MSPVSTVSIQRAAGGIGRRAPNKDGVSGMIFYDEDLISLPVFAANPIQKVFSLRQAEALGIAENSVVSGMAHYHVEEFFNGNPDGELWIGAYILGGGTYDEVFDFCDDSLIAGEIRQLAVYDAGEGLIDLANVNTLQSKADALRAVGKPLSIIYFGDTGLLANDLGDAPDLRTAQAPAVSIPITGSASGKAPALETLLGRKVGCMGKMLGLTSRASVNESIGHVAQFNAQSGQELDQLQLITGQSYDGLTLTQLGALKDKGYTIIIKRLPTTAGSYFDRVPVAVAATDDFAWMEINRTSDKAERLLKTAYEPFVNANIGLNDDGTILNEVIIYLEELGAEQLDQMEADGEISNYELLIDPSQNILQDSNLDITARIQPTGIAEFINITIGLTTSI